MNKSIKDGVSGEIISEVETDEEPSEDLHGTPESRASEDLQESREIDEFDMSPDNPIVIITAPHSLCVPDAQERTCDEISEYAASKSIN